MSKEQSGDQFSPESLNHSSIPPTKVSRSERRSERRINLDFETAVPVLVRTEEQMYWGLARNISEHGMLIQMQSPPPMGTQVDVTLTGIRGIGHDDDAFELTGEVRHHLAWNYHAKGVKKAVTAVGVRFCRRMNPFNPERGWIH